MIVELVEMGLESVVMVKNTGDGGSWWCSLNGNGSGGGRG